jgi:hypothetical protein
MTSGCCRFLKEIRTRCQRTRIVKIHNWPNLDTYDTAGPDAARATRPGCRYKWLEITTMQLIVSARCTRDTRCDTTTACNWRARVNSCRSGLERLQRWQHLLAHTSAPSVTMYHIYYRGTSRSGSMRRTACFDAYEARQTPVPVPTQLLYL